MFLPRVALPPRPPLALLHGCFDALVGPLATQGAAREVAGADEEFFSGRPKGVGRW